MLIQDGGDDDDDDDKRESKTPRMVATTFPVTFFEMGAGRGMLGLEAAGASGVTRQPTNLVLIERRGSRSKAETMLRNPGRPREKEKNPTAMTTTTTQPYMDLSSVQWSCIQCDLAHVDMATILQEQNISTLATPSCQMHAIAKHLCGAGTDLAQKHWNL